MFALAIASLILTAGLDRAEQLYEQARYDEALSALGPTCPPENFVSCERVRAFALIALGREDDARAAFDRLLVHTPDASLADDVSPKLHSTFNNAKRSLAWVMALELEPVNVGTALASWPLSVKPQTEVALQRLRAFVAVSGTTSFTEVPLSQEGGAWVGVFEPDGEVMPSAPRYYLIATLPSGAEVNLGDAQSSRPLVLSVKGGDAAKESDRGALGFFGIEGGKEGGTGGADDGEGERILGLPPWGFWTAAGGAAVVVTTVVLLVVLGGGDDTGDLRVNVELGN